jgi:ADP-heptose:LPS heptosyltransferase
MKILALQLKRIGDLILTTPALRRLRQAWPEAHITLGVMNGTAALLPAIPQAHAGIVFGRGRGFAPWQQVMSGGWDICLDFTGNDRSAFATALSRAGKRVAFEAGRKNKLRALAYNEWSPSLVREVHTTQHYLDLVAHIAPASPEPATELLPELSLPASSAKNTGPAGSYALLHPGTARPEKYWLADRWSAVAAHLRDRCGLRPVFTSGPDAYERAHVAQAAPDFQSPPDLLSLATLVAGARLVVSCDTAVVHLAAAFRVPQIALFGPTNPFHWRPMHEHAIVLSAAQPNAPLTAFTPRMKGAPMDRISTEAVIRAIDSLLAPPRGS